MSLPELPETWKPSMMPHPKTSRLARFRPDHPPFSINESTRIANMLYDARCEVRSRIEPGMWESPLHISSSGSILAYACSGGRNHEIPYLSYFVLDEISRKSFLPRQVKWQIPGSKDLHHLTADEGRKLLFAADHDSIKSYEWGSPVEEYHHTRQPLPVHTLDAGRHHGPLHISDSRSIWRAGKRSIAIWNIDDLETHGPDGKGIIGRVRTPETWLDADRGVRRSSGSTPHSTATYDDSISIGDWHPHPQMSGTMICAGDIQYKEDYRCSAVNFDQGGKVVARYLGHGGCVESFSTSPGDPNLLVTACTDSYTRIFDLRRPLPVMMFDGSFGDDACTAAILTHPDGIPSTHHF